MNEEICIEIEKLYRRLYKGLDFMYSRNNFSSIKNQYLQQISVRKHLLNYLILHDSIYQLLFLLLQTK